MPCRHEKGDPDCSSSTPAQKAGWIARQIHRLGLDPAQIGVELRRLAGEEVASPDPDDFKIVGLNEPGGGYIVLRVRYPSCARCAFEGDKVLVFRGVSMLHILGWRKLDPHFRADVPAQDLNKLTKAQLADLRVSAPSPIARFPATDQGWLNAIRFCQVMNGSVR